jgi:hypothetical protein
MFDTLRMLKGLSPAERATIQSGEFSGEFSADALLDQMRTLARFDATNDATRARLKGLLGVSIALTFLPLFVVKVQPVVVLSFCALALICAIYIGVILSRLSRMDISNNFREIALPFLAVLKQDIDHDKVLTVRIDLRSATDAKKKQGSGKPYAHGAYKSIVDTTYRDPWFEGSARLSDGSILRWNVTDEICESKRTKRSSSGKMKTKTRNLKRSVVAVSLAVANKTYGVNETLQSSRHKVAVLDGGKRRVIKLTRKLKTKSLDPIEPGVLIDAVSSAYKRVQAPQRSAA